MSWLSVKSGSEVVLPNTTFLDAWRGVLWDFDVDLTATGVLDETVPVDGEDFVANFLLDADVLVKVPGLDAIGTEVEVFVPVAVIGVVGCPITVRMGGREEFTSKRVDHHFCGYIADESDSRVLLLYSNNVAS